MLAVRKFQSSGNIRFLAAQFKNIFEFFLSYDGKNQKSIRETACFDKNLKFGAPEVTAS